MQKNIFNTNEASKYLDISKSSLYKLTQQRKIPFSKPNGGKMYFQKEDLDNWMLSNRSKSIEEVEQKIVKHLNKNSDGKKIY